MKDRIPSDKTRKAKEVLIERILSNSLYTDKLWSVRKLRHNLNYLSLDGLQLLSDIIAEKISEVKPR